MGGARCGEETFSRRPTRQQAAALKSLARVSMTTGRLWARTRTGSSQDSEWDSGFVGFALARRPRSGPGPGVRLVSAALPPSRCGSWFRSRGRVLNQLCARADVPEPRCCFWFLHGFSATFPPQPAGPNWTSGSGAIYLCSEKVLVPPLVGGVTGQDCTQRRSPGQNQEAQDPVRVQFGPV